MRDPVCANGLKDGKMLMNPRSQKRDLGLLHWWANAGTAALLWDDNPNKQRRWRVLRRRSVFAAVEDLEIVALVRWKELGDVAQAFG